MQYEPLRNSELKVSELCLGAMTFGENWVGVQTKIQAVKSMKPVGKLVREFI